MRVFNWSNVCVFYFEMNPKKTVGVELYKTYIFTKDFLTMFVKQIFVNWLEKLSNLIIDIQKIFTLISFKILSS